MLEEIKQLEEQLKQKKQEALESLLQQRQDIERQLAELGHHDASSTIKPPAKKRGRKPKVRPAV